MSESESTPSPTRTVAGRSVPAAGAWAVDATHSSVGFVVRHMMVAKVRGSFADYAVNLAIGEDPAETKLDVTIQAASLTTGDEGRDGHVKSAEFLDVETFPTLTFTSTAVRPGSGDESWIADGDLTIHGVTRSVELRVDFGGAAVDPWGNTKAFFSAQAEIDREDFGLTWNQPLANGGVLIGKKITIEIEIEATPA